MRTARATAIACLALLPLCASAYANTSLPTCARLAGLILHDQNVNFQQGLILHDWEKNYRKVLAATSVIQPATATDAAYCLVNLTQAPTVNITVGLPLSAADGGSGGVQGAWNGRDNNLGEGGFGGSVGSVTSATDLGFVGSSTDTGHSNAWCNALNPITGEPNAQPDCGAAGGGFVLAPNNNLLWWQIDLYIRQSMLSQTLWTLELTKIYYGQKPEYNYFTGCSGGGRQAAYMAQNFPELFDGYVVGAPAINFDRFIEGQLWSTVVVQDLLGSGGLAPAKSRAAAAAANTACGSDYGAGLGIIGEPRQCNFDANSLRCTGKPTDPPTCLTPQEAKAINMIWNGPRNEKGERLWGGVPKGTVFDTLLPGGVGPTPIVETWPENWVHQDPTFNVFNITTSNFDAEFEKSYYKFENFIELGTDSTNLDGVIKRGAKIIWYHGAADPLTLTFTSYNYTTRAFERYGVPEMQKFMRTFFYPGNAHCGGGTGPQINAPQILQVLQNWVENDVAPDYIVASGTVNGSTPITRPICKYPDEPGYNGSGSIYDASNFHCVVHNKEPDNLADYDATNHDHPKTDPLLRFKSDNDHDH